jgi:hypothetical protein
MFPLTGGAQYSRFQQNSQCNLLNSLSFISSLSKIHNVTSWTHYRSFPHWRFHIQSGKWWPLGNELKFFFRVCSLTVLRITVVGHHLDPDETLFTSMSWLLHTVVKGLTILSSTFEDGSLQQLYAHYGIFKLPYNTRAFYVSSRHGGAPGFTPWNSHLHWRSNPELTTWQALDHSTNKC